MPDAPLAPQPATDVTGNDNKISTADRISRIPVIVHQGTLRQPLVRQIETACGGDLARISRYTSAAMLELLTRLPADRKQGLPDLRADGPVMACSASLLELQRAVLYHPEGMTYAETVAYETMRDEHGEGLAALTLRALFALRHAMLDAAVPKGR